jgi:hypothetical protein
MAKIEGIPPTAAMKHYHLSLRRLAKNYQSFQRRTQPATLAATLMLGFYEVWNSEHDKWCKHMWGARAILKELPLPEMTRKVLDLRKKRRQALQDLRISHQNEGIFAGVEDEEPDITDVDPDLLAQLSGCGVYYADSVSSRVESKKQTPRHYTEQDVENFEHLSDLFWWYCKMDVYQSILGGTRLLSVFLSSAVVFPMIRSNPSLVWSIIYGLNACREGQ